MEIVQSLNEGNPGPVHDCSPEYKSTVFNHKTSLLAEETEIKRAKIARPSRVANWISSDKFRNEA